MSNYFLILCIILINIQNCHASQVPTNKKQGLLINTTNNLGKCLAVALFNNRCPKTVNLINTFMSKAELAKKEFDDFKAHISYEKLYYDAVEPLSIIEAMPIIEYSKDSETMNLYLTDLFKRRKAWRELTYVKNIEEKLNNIVKKMNLKHFSSFLASKDELYEHGDPEIKKILKQVLTVQGITTIGTLFNCYNKKNNKTSITLKFKTLLPFTSIRYRE